MHGPQGQAATQKLNTKTCTQILAVIYLNRHNDACFRDLMAHIFRDLTTVVWCCMRLYDVQNIWRFFCHTEVPSDMLSSSFQRILGGTVPTRPHGPKGRIMAMTSHRQPSPPSPLYNPPIVSSSSVAHSRSNTSGDASSSSSVGQIIAATGFLTCLALPAWADEGPLSFLPNLGGDLVIAFFFYTVVALLAIVTIGVSH